MTDRERLEKLLEQSGENKGLCGATKDGKQVGRGNIPVHYKRCTIPEEDRKKYIRIGLREIFAHFDQKLYYTQALIAGVILSGDYDKVGVITSSQYGKSFLMGMVSLLLAYNGHRVNVAAATGEKTDIIMRYCRWAASHAANELKEALTGETLKKIDRLDQSLSKERLSFVGKGQVQGVTLGDTFSGISHNKAVGQGGAYIVDEAALPSSESLAEIGRREFSTVDDSKEPLIMISNPHNAGYFYDFITQDEMYPRECVIWMDALTACQEGRWTVEKVLSSDFSRHRDTLQRYLLCELPSEGGGMFTDPVITQEIRTGYRVMGVDAAYKGKDDIVVCVADHLGDKVVMRDIATIKKGEWIDGVTSVEIIEQIARLYHAMGCVLCCVDTGFGVWLKEGLVLRGVSAKGIEFGSGPTRERVRDRRYCAVYARNKRAEMHMDLAEMMDYRSVEFTQSVYDEIKDVLPLITSDKTPSGKVQVTPKPEVKAKLGHSPDAFDAVLLALHAAVLYSEDSVMFAEED